MRKAWRNLLKRLQAPWEMPWMTGRRRDPQHFYGRAFTSKHSRKVKKVRTLWTFGGITMLSLGHPALIVGLALLLTFISFSLLDETP
ncbi:hypothetical protein [Balneatrix alpica]|uniref:Uncharacterized protein n=1 Tax=Balneatrix alpica TaxID=75684 RepID=A0ABV5Z9V6_9GAMM|nr:hypothetical protein [Balneatrix alpica]